MYSNISPRLYYSINVMGTYTSKCFLLAFADQVITERHRRCSLNDIIYVSVYVDAANSVKV